MTDLLSVDVDDSAVAMSESFGIPLPKDHLSPVPDQIAFTLDLLAEWNNSATFFVQGWMAISWPALIRRIAAAGHEVASHGMTHHLVNELPRARFFATLTDSRKLLEDTTGTAVCGYRSPSFSIVPFMDEAAELIRAAGYLYDSSAHFTAEQIGAVGVSAAPQRVVLRNGLIEFPLTTLFFSGRGISLGSSFYCRKLPRRVYEYLLGAVKSSGVDLHLYFHPWELAGETLPLWRRFASLRQLAYRGSERVGAARLQESIGERQFARISDLL